MAKKCSYQCSRCRPSRITIRKATRKDLDAMLAVGLAAFPQNPVWHYRYPYHHEYPYDHIKYSRRRIAEYLDAAENGSRIVMVAEAPSREDPYERVVVAFAVWWMTGFHTTRYQEQKQDKKSQSFLNEQYIRRDGHPGRMKKFLEVLDKAKAEYFDRSYGEDQLYLYNLATHPDYQRRGAATALVQWALDFAEREEMPVGLFASEVGKTLYTKLGFEEIGTATVQVDGEDEKFVTPAMVYLPRTFRQSLYDVFQ